MSSNEQPPRVPGELSPEDRARLKDRAAEIGAGLDRIKARQETSKGGSGKRSGFDGSGSTGMGDGFRFVIELLVGICFGAFLGWGIDKALGSAPWGMIVMTILGFAAGFWNVIKAAQRSHDALPPEKRNAPSVKDDPKDD